MIGPVEDDLISIIIPVYDVEPYIRQCLDSVLSQTYTNLEIIIVASDSGDRSVHICEEYSEKDGRITVVKRQALGLSDAKNVGIEHSSGDYVGFIDGDDYVSQSFIETLHSLCIVNNSEIAQCGYVVVGDNSKGNKAQKDSIGVEVFSNIGACMNLYNDLYVPTVVSWSKLYRRELFDDVRFPVGRIHEDEATTHRLLYKANRVAVSRKGLYYYRKVAGSIMGAPYNLKRLDYFQALDERLDFFQRFEQPVLYSLTRERYLKKLIENRKLLRKHIPGNKELQKDLGQKIGALLPVVIADPNVAVKNRIMILGFLLFPGASLAVLRMRGLY